MSFQRLFPVSHRRWTEGEKEIVRKHYQKFGAKRLSETFLPNRSPEAIRHIAWRLGLTGKICRAWSDEELRVLKEYYPKIGLKIMKFLDRSRGVIKNKARELGLSKERQKVKFYINQNLSESEWAYIAGILDGEGTINLQRGTPYIAIHNTSLELMKWLTKKLGIPMTYMKNRWRPKAHKPCYTFRFGGVKRVIAFLEKVMPYLIVKRKRAEEVYKFCEGK